MHIESREYIVKQNNCGSGVDRSGECHACLLKGLQVVRSARGEGRTNLLAATQCQPFLPHFRFVSRFK